MAPLRPLLIVLNPSDWIDQEKDNDAAVTVSAAAAIRAASNELAEEDQADQALPPRLTRLSIRKSSATSSNEEDTVGNNSRMTDGIQALIGGQGTGHRLQATRARKASERSSRVQQTLSPEPFPGLWITLSTGFPRQVTPSSDYTSEMICERLRQVLLETLEDMKENGWLEISDESAAQ